MRAFVTGGAGFIGSHLVDRLVREGYERIVVYDNFSSGRREFIEHHLGKRYFRLVEADLLDWERVDRELEEEYDVVFHLAAIPDVRIGSIKPEVSKIDIMATYNLLDAMRRRDIEKIVFSSSSTVYGEAPPIPLKEDFGPLLPISMYGAAKLACEGLISSFSHTYDMKAWIFRFANVVGPRCTHGVIYDFIRKLRKNPEELEILGDGRQKKSYLYISDCIDGMIYAFERSKERINLFNLGTEGATEVNEIARMVVEEMGLKNVRFRYTGGDRGWKGDVPRFRFDIGKIRSMGWRPRYDSDEAVRRAIRDLLREI
ncbi:MAG: UDP-glucose 4-epimerase [Thermoplasmata archaeon]|nr:MAG: UDP-glucose 4-epimerase [Thermoplasmata archaeon]HDO68885.1 NAD-dependent epimerase/dehydratase family protein [Thermoplasmatales archaeon]HEX16800.1 NAD-dependent epimerase/dehydratase family protein [Thermoplasmatales archaeon]